MPLLYRLIGDPSDNTYLFEDEPDLARYELVDTAQGAMDEDEDPATVEDLISESDPIDSPTDPAEEA